MRLAHAVVTCVARDDLEDGGAGAIAATVEAIRRRRPTTTVEVLISDCKGDESALASVFAARPDIPTTTSRPSPACSGRSGPRRLRPEPDRPGPGGRTPASP